MIGKVSGFIAFCALIFTAGSYGAAWAQDFPTRPVRIVDGFPPGGGTDTLSRAISHKLTQRWDQPVVVDNRPGAGSNLGAGIVAKAAPDGYTVFMGLAGVLAPSMTLYPKLDYNLLTDLTAVTKVASGTYVMLVNASLPAKSVQELIALAKKKDGALRYSSAGVGTPAHLAGERFNLGAGVNIQHVPYKGGAAAAAAIASGEAHMTFVSVPAGLPLVKSGKARAIAVTPQKTKAFPGVPTIADSDLPGFEIRLAYGLFAPAGTPKPILDKWAAEVARILRMPDVVERLTAFGLEPDPSTPDEFGRLIKEEVTLWAKVIKEANIRVP